MSGALPSGLGMRFAASSARSSSRRSGSHGVMRPTAMESTALTEAIELHRNLRGDTGTLDAVAATAAWYADTVAAAPDSFDAGEHERALAMIAAVNAAIGLANKVHTGRTERLDRRNRNENGTVSVSRTFGRGTEADDYELLDGAPVGQCESLESAKREAAARRDEAQWALRNRLADEGLATTRKQRKNAATKARRAAR